jgi:T5orf172 domain
MEALARRLLPPLPSDPLLLTHIQRRAESDLAFRSYWRELEKALPLFVLSRQAGGSGFRMANLLRSFFTEYGSRLLRFGPDSMPTSFNIVEAFLQFSESYLIFDLRQESEHLLRLYEYFNWYTTEGGPFAKNPGALKAIMADGLIYSYDTIGAADDFKLRAGDSDVLILGVSLIRHAEELSVIVSAAERPPYPSDAEIKQALEHPKYPRGKETMRPHPSLTIADRYVPGFRGYAQVLMLSRITLDARKYDARYVSMDLGSGYRVATDDPDGLQEFARETGDLLSSSGMGLHDAEQMKQILGRYEELFSAATSLIYLPAFFVAHPSGVVEEAFVTELFIDRNRQRVRRALRVLGRQELPFHRTVRCFVSGVPSNEAAVREISPPELRFASEGYWRPLDPGEIGQDKSGNAIVGKTWVERHESWAARDPSSLLVRKATKLVVGLDPGFLYVMRSPSHERDVFKIGLTRRDPGRRADELGEATGVPLPFEVLAEWEVGDCGAAEADIHQQLASFRLSKRREFFRAPLSALVTVIQQVVSTNESGIQTETKGRPKVHEKERAQ